MQLLDGYHLGPLLGRGAYGEVYEATHRSSGRPVAIKLVPPQLGPNPEVVALRNLRLPGVVELLDDGPADGRHALVMARVEGSPWPGRSGPLAWSAARPLVAQLAQSLQALHASGLAHRDLKPSNVFVTPDGRVVLLDFGLAAPLGGPPREFISGNPFGIAPEVLLGAAPSAAADLYGLGVLVFLALTGEPPFADPMDRLTTDAPGLPGPEGALCAALLQRDPAARVAAAAAHLPDLNTPWGDLSSQGDIRDMLVGPERLLRVRSRAATQVWRLAGEQPAQIGTVLNRLVAEGLLVRDGHRGRVSPTHLEQLELRSQWPLLLPDATVSLDGDALDLLRWLLVVGPEVSEADIDDRLGPDHSPLDDLYELGLVVATAQGWQLVAAPSGALVGWSDALLQQAHRDAATLWEGRRALLHAVLGGWAERAEELAPAEAATWRERGAWQRAWVTLELVRRRWPDSASLVRQQVDVAIRSMQAPLLERSMRSALEAQLPAVQPLLRAALLACHGRSDRALRAAEHLSRAVDPELVAGVRVRAAMGRPSAWATLDLAALPQSATVQNWRGIQAYWSGAFAEAARWHESALTVATTDGERMAAAINGASAALEAFQPERARELANKAISAARRARAQQSMVRAAVLRRAARYRAAEVLEVDRPLLETVAAMNMPDQHGYLALTEAAVAWRAGQRSDASALALRAAEHLGERAGGVPALLARALAQACGATDDTEALRRTAEACPLPRVRAQVLALLDWHGPAGDGGGPRMEVLSPEEVGPYGASGMGTSTTA